MEDHSTTYHELTLPGFRFHPTEEELLSFYLNNKIFQKESPANVIGFLNIYNHDPWDLPGLAKTKIGQREWYFFVPRDRKSGRQGRPNRTTRNGFWKATGSERKVISLSNPKKMIGLKKTMVFYKGRAPRGCKTDWVMNEFRLPDTSPFPTDLVLCKVYRKATSLKVLEQKAAMEEETSNLSQPITPSLSLPMNNDHHPLYNSNDHQDLMAVASQMVLTKKDEEQVVMEEDEGLFLVQNLSTENEETSAISETNRIHLPVGQAKLADLLVPNFSVDWTQDPYWAQLWSPWFDSWAFYANTLNF